MRALLTGASGFLGGRLTQMLAERGAELTILARAGSDLRHLHGVALRRVEGHLTDAAALSEAMRGNTHVFHCAAASTDWAPERTYIDTNVVGTEMVLEAASREPGLERLVHVSTTDVYGYPVAPGDESLPLMDAGLPYGRTKLEGERAVWRYAAKGLPITVVRPATIFGPRSKDFVVEIASMLRQRLMLLIDGGRARGGFCYVDNVASAMMSASASDEARGQAYNLIDSTGVTWHGYVEALAQGLGLRKPWIDLPFRTAYEFGRWGERAHRTLRLPGRPLLTRHAVYLMGRDQEFPAEKAFREFGYRAEISFEDGMERTLRWLRELPR